MDKQKQIEEMAKVIEESMAKARRTLGGHNNIAMFYATMLSNAGYCKIPENAVVWTEEELFARDEKLYKAEREYISALEKCVNNRGAKERKETAEKFAKMAKARLNEWLEDNEDLDGKIDFGIAQIELIGVKSLDGEIIAESLIEEICKEITDKEVQNGN